MPDDDDTERVVRLGEAFLVQTLRKVCTILDIRFDEWDTDRYLLRAILRDTNGKLHDAAVVALFTEYDLVLGKIYKSDRLLEAYKKKELTLGDKINPKLKYFYHIYEIDINAIPPEP